MGEFGAARKISTLWDTSIEYPTNHECVDYQFWGTVAMWDLF